MAGSFYAATAASLRGQIEAAYTHPLGPGSVPQVASAWRGGIWGLVCPHAGYLYSGPVAAHSFSQLAAQGPPPRIVILGPNHYGLGSALALDPHQAWETPLGRSSLDEELARSILAAAPFLKVDAVPHLREHSIEVQLPFLQHLFGEGVSFLPLSMRDQSLETSQSLGAALAQVLQGQEALLLASTDFTHYESHDSARAKDRHALEAIQALDPLALDRAIGAHDISMCGPGPVMALLSACQLLGLSRCQLLKYGTSGETGGDYAQVVGYASFILTAPSEVA